MKGLKTIIPFAGIASWYDYTNSQGIPIRNTANYADSLASNNAGGVFLDDEWREIDSDYGAWLWTIAREQEETNGDYAPVWEDMDYTTDEENHIACSALIVNGLNDQNVTTRHADLMMEAFEKAGQTAKLVLHQNGHMTLDGISVNGRVWEEIMNLWLSHYLYGVENGAEALPKVLAQSNITGRFEAFDQWPASNAIILKDSSAKGIAAVTSHGVADYSEDFQEDWQNNLTFDEQEAFYSGMPDQIAAVYRFDLPAGVTIQGTPKLRVRLDSDREGMDGLMISAVLMDVSDAGAFKTYSTETALDDLVATEELEDCYDLGFGGGGIAMSAFKQTDKPRKLISKAWTDLQNPGCGKASSEYTVQYPGLISGQEQDYTFYFKPTVYTVAEGHHLELVLMTWDPYCVYLDAWFNLDGSLDTMLDDSTYTMVISNESLELILPVGEGDPDWTLAPVEQER